MPADRKFTVEAEGKKFEVEVPKGWVHEAEVAEKFSPKDSFMQEVERRAASISQGLRKPEDLINDETFLKQAAERKKDFFTTLLGVKTPEGSADILKIQQEAADRVRASELKPIQDQNVGLMTEVEILRTRDLDLQVAMAAPLLNIEPEMVELVQLYVKPRMAYDPTMKAWFVKKTEGDGFELSREPKKGGHPWMGAVEYLETIARSGERKAWFTAKGQPGPAFRGGKGGGAIGLEEFQKLSPAEQTQFYNDHPVEFREFQQQIRQKGEQALMAAGSR